MTQLLRVLFPILGIILAALACSREKSEGPFVSASQSELKIAINVAQAGA